MNAKLKKEWVEALRSGEYKQGKGALRRVSAQDGKGKFCCLGVLCDLINPDGWLRVPAGPVEHELRRGDDELLRRKAEEIAELDSWVQRRLAFMNDIGTTFDKIADYIEAAL